VCPALLVYLLPGNDGSGSQHENGAKYRIAALYISHVLVANGLHRVIRELTHDLSLKIAAESALM